MLIIGITGGSGAGKTSAVTALETLGAKAIDCDVLYHELLRTDENLTNEIVANFENVLTDGKLDRKKLGAIVFNDSDALLTLNKITHRFITLELERRIDSFRVKNVKIVAIDAIALIESGLSAKCNVIIGIIAPEDERVSRIVQRDGLTKEQALTRINAQKPESFFKEMCDFIIENAFDTSTAFEEHCENYFTHLIDTIVSN